MITSNYNPHPPLRCSAKCGCKIVYGLADPLGVIHYVGKSNSGLCRPKTHAVRAPKECGRKAAWIRSLLNSGTCYSIVVLEQVFSEKDLSAAERRWISFGRKNDWPLTNQTDGGEGTTGYLAPQSVRLKMSLSRKGQPKSVEHRKRIGDAHRGRKKELTPAFLASQRLKSAGNVGRKHPASAFENKSRALRGKKRRPLTVLEKEHLSTVLSGRPFTERHLTRVREARVDRALHLEVHGVFATLSQWSTKTGIAFSVLRSRLHNGWSIEKAVTTPPTTPLVLVLNGVSDTVAGWSKRIGIHPNHIRWRLARGYPCRNSTLT